MPDSARSSPGEGGGRDERRVQAVLKGAIAVMSLLLVGGIIVVFATIFHRMSGPGASAPFTGELPPAGQVRSVALDGDRMALVMENEDGSSSVHVYDMARGEWIGRLAPTANGAAPARR